MFGGALRGEKEVDVCACVCVRARACACVKKEAVRKQKAEKEDTRMCQEEEHITLKRTKKIKTK